MPLPPAIGRRGPALETVEPFDIADDGTGRDDVTLLFDVPDEEDEEEDELGGTREPDDEEPELELLELEPPDFEVAEPDELDDEPELVRD